MRGRHLFDVEPGVGVRVVVRVAARVVVRVSGSAFFRCWIP